MHTTGWTAVLATTLLVSGCQVDLPGTTGPSGPGPDQVSARVAYVLDGDTVAVEIDPSSQQLVRATDKNPAVGHVRLLGIDAPEMHPEGSDEPECGATEARDELRALLPRGTAITIATDADADTHDRYDRTLGYVETHRKDVNATMLERGRVAAWYPAGAPRPSRYPHYLELQEQAQGTGSWPVCGTLGRD